MKPVIFFDLDNTLYDQRKILWKTAVNLRPDLDLSFKEASRMILEAGDNRWIFVKRVLRLENGSHARKGEILRSFDREMIRQVGKIDHLPDLLAPLSSKYKLALATNGGGRNQMEKIKALGIRDFFEAFFISGRMGVKKPDPAFFSRLKKWAGIDPCECLFVGDSMDFDILPAKKAGFRTCQITKNTNSTADFSAKDIKQFIWELP